MGRLMARLMLVILMERMLLLFVLEQMTHSVQQLPQSMWTVALQRPNWTVFLFQTSGRLVHAVVPQTPGAENDPQIATVAASGASTITGDIDGRGDSNHIIEAATGTTLTINSTLLDSEDETGTFKFQGEGDINIGVPGVLDSGKIVGNNMNVVKAGTGTLTIATEPSAASTDTSNATGISWGGTTTVQEGRMTILGWYG